MITVLIWGPSTAEHFERFPIPDEQMLGLFRRLVDEPPEQPGGCSSTLSPDGQTLDAAAAGNRRVTLSVTITTAVDPSQVGPAVKMALGALA